MRLLTATTCILLAIPCLAATYTVDDDGPSDFDSIQDAIDFADHNDVIIVYQGIYEEEIEFLGKAITVRSSDPNNPDVVLNTQIYTYGYGECIYFFDEEDANTVLNGFYIGGYLTECGGIYCGNHSSPKILNCMFSGNVDGSIVCQDYSNPIISGCTFIDNFAAKGGAIFCRDYSNPIIFDCTFIDNTAIEDGGAIYCEQSNPVITRCTFSGNSALGFDDIDGYGGAILCCGNSGLTVTDCVFSRNSANYGGGMYCIDNSSPTVTNCTFSQNTAVYRGGGIRCNWDNKATVSNCTFTANLAQYGAAAASSWGHTNPTFVNCTFIANKANQGGGINCREAGATLINSIFWANTAANGNEIALEDRPTSEEFPMIDVNFCNIQGGQSAIYSNDPNNIINWGPGNIDIDPCFVDPGYWDPNGTPADANDDFWVGGDYHLKSAGWRWDRDANQWTWDDVTSRCIDAGNPGSPLGDEPLTLEVDPLNRWGENLRINMGAFGGTAEASMPPYDWALLSDITNDGKTDLIDFAHLANIFMMSDDKLFTDFNRDGGVNFKDLALFISDWLDTTTWY